MKTSYRHVGITTNVADWTDEEAESALSLIQGWNQPDPPKNVAELKERARQLRAKGYERMPPCAEADEHGRCPGHVGELFQTQPVHNLKVRL